MTLAPARSTFPHLDGASSFSREKACPGAAGKAARPMRSEVEVRVMDILRRECRVSAPLAPETRLVEDLGLDSLGFLTLAVALENHYRVRLEEDPEVPPRTVAEVVDLVVSRL